MRVRPMRSADRARDVARLNRLLGTRIAPGIVHRFSGTNQHGQRTLTLEANGDGTVRRALLTSRTQLGAGFMKRQAAVTARGAELTDVVSDGMTTTRLYTTLPVRGAVRRDLGVARPDGFTQWTSTRDAINARPVFSYRSDDVRAWAAPAVELARTLGHAITIQSGTRRWKVNASDDPNALVLRVEGRVHPE